MASAAQHSIGTDRGRARAFAAAALVAAADSFTFTTTNSIVRERPPSRLNYYVDDELFGSYYDPNRWAATDDEKTAAGGAWEDQLARRDDGSLWSSFEASDSSEEMVEVEEDPDYGDTDFDGEVWLDALASISRDEINFMAREADRADKARQMNDMGFSPESISSVLDVATDEGREVDPTNEALEAFKEHTSETGFGMMRHDETDMTLVESHTTVEWDHEAGQPVRSQQIYVDEVTCVGCTLCATVAQSTFFMEEGEGRARVFQQWGDDDETIESAIDTCPVNCIHHVTYDELRRLEIERREQSINRMGRLVGGACTARNFGGTTFTDEQDISTEMEDDFEERERKRKEDMARREMRRKMESLCLRAEL